MRHPLTRAGARAGAARRLGAAAATLALVLALALALAGTLVLAGRADAALADAPDPDDERSLSVDVTDGTAPTPTPSNASPGSSPPSGSDQSPRPPAVGSRGGGGDGGANAPVTTGDVTQATIPDPAAADDALGDDAAAAGGILAVSGLTARASPSIDIGNGYVTLDFVVRNNSSESFDSSAEFWVDNAFGARIAEIDDVEVDDLEPDETRRVQVRIEGLGQNIVLHAHTTLTPPKSLDGVELEPMTRDASILVPPWFSILLVSGLGSLGGLGWWLYRSRGLGIRLVPLRA